MENSELESLLKQAINVSQKDVLSFEEARIYLDVSKSFLYKLTSKNELSFSKPNGGKIYFKKSVLNEWMEKNPVHSKEFLDKNLKIRKND